MQQTFFDYFSTLKDPRVNRNKLHSLNDILFLTVCAVMSGCNDWEEIEEYGREKEPWLKKHIGLPNGIPSHDTINRLFARLDPKKLQECFICWVGSLVGKVNGKLVNIDGKRLCNGGGDGKKSMVHLVNAWCNENSMLIGQVKTDAKSNEITAIPALLDMPDIEGAAVTIDAMGCQTTIAEKIVVAGGDYVLAVKGNQKSLFDDIRDAFARTPGADRSETLETGHGRIEKRTCSVITDLDWVNNADKWEGLASIVKVGTERTGKQTGEKATEQRFYISSLKKGPEVFNKIIRGHWGIENGLHWGLGVVFKEDLSTKQAGNAAENFSMICKVCLYNIKER